MAIAFDATSTGTVGAASSLTVAHTCSGANRLLIVTCQSNSGAAGTITGVTYNGVSMTQKVEWDTANGPFYVFYLAAPATGTNNIVISADRGTNAISMAAASYTGCAQGATVIDSSNTSTDSGTSSIAKSVTSTVDNCWGILCGGVSGGSGSITAGANTTERVDSNSSIFYDSNAAISPAGSLTLNASYVSNITWRMWYGTIAPVSLVTNKNLTLLGVG